MSVFSENMSAVSSEFDSLFGEEVTVTPKGGSTASITGRLGPEQIDEEVNDTRRGRYVSRPFAFDPANGPDAVFVNGEVAIEDGTTYRVEAVQSRTESKIVLKLSRRVASEISGPEHRMRR